jgi:hypothetical protein
VWFCDAVETELAVVDYAKDNHHIAPPIPILRDGKRATEYGKGTGSSLALQDEYFGLSSQTR